MRCFVCSCVIEADVSDTLRWQLWLENIAEVNPCKVNGASLSSSVQLKQGDVISIGGRDFHFCEHATGSIKRSSKIRRPKAIAVSPYRAAMDSPAPASGPEDTAVAEDKPSDASQDCTTTMTDGLVAPSSPSATFNEVESASSPVGSKLLMRKMQMQILAKTRSAQTVTVCV